jgi:polyphenol oxidase
MIASDQPAIFGKNVRAAVSSINDGNMKFGVGDDTDTLKNRKDFLQKLGIKPHDTTLVKIQYKDAEHFARYRIVQEDHKSEGMLDSSAGEPADALVVTKPGHALFLPLADCVGVILHDPTKNVLMVSHVGRHSAEIEGAKKSVEYMEQSFKTNPADIKVWLSPAAGRAKYPLFAMGGQSLHDVILQQLSRAGVRRNNIEVSNIDTTNDANYFSHSEFLAGNRSDDGRFVIVAQMMFEQGEPAA